jgi:hypothetical protein
LKRPKDGGFTNLLVRRECRQRLASRIALGDLAFLAAIEGGWPTKLLALLIRPGAAGLHAGQDRASLELRNAGHDRDDQLADARGGVSPRFPEADEGRRLPRSHAGCLEVTAGTRQADLDDAVYGRRTENYLCGLKDTASPRYAVVLHVTSRSAASAALSFRLSCRSKQTTIPRSHLVNPTTHYDGDDALRWDHREFIDGGYREKSTTPFNAWPSPM